MQVSRVRFLRRASFLLAVAVVLSVGVNYVITWKRRLGIVQQAAEILGSEMLRSADLLEYSEHRNGVLQFKLKAERLLETRQGTNLLQGIEAFDTNPDGSRRNQIRSEKAEYDRTRNVVRFMGNVRILTSKGIEIQTQFLEYDRAAQVGLSKDQVRIVGKEGQGVASGFRYEQVPGRLEIFGPIDFTGHQPAGKAGPTAIQGDVRITAAAGHYSQVDRLVKLSGGAHVESSNGSLSGDLVEAWFDGTGKKVKSLTCEGNSVYRTAGPSGTRELRGDRLDFSIGEVTRALERIDIHGNGAFIESVDGAEQELRGAEIQVELDSSSGQARVLRSRSGTIFRRKAPTGNSVVSGGNLDATFIEGTGLLKEVRVWDKARMAVENAGQGSGDDLSSSSLTLEFGVKDGKGVPSAMRAEGQVRWKQTVPPPKGSKGPTSERSLQSALLEMKYGASGESPESGNARGDVVIEGLSGAGGSSAIRKLLADRVDFAFFPAGNRMKSFAADGNVRATYVKPPAAKKDRSAPEGDSPQEMHSTSSRLEAGFRESDGAVESVVQAGNVVFRDSLRTATAGRSDYQAASDLLVLTESPVISDDSGVTTGQRVEYNRRAGVLTVRGKVRTTLKPGKGGVSGPFGQGAGASATLVTADTMEYWSEENRARYSGKTQLLSESSQLQVDVLEIRQGGEALHGSGNVRHLIVKTSAMARPGQSPAAKAGSKTSEKSSTDTPILITGRTLDYSKSQNNVNYSGSVRLSRGDMTMDSESLDAYFDTDGKRIERAHARKQLRIVQGARRVSGDEAEYYLEPEKVVVTGNPAEMSDPVRGKSSARRLTFHTTDDTILLESR